jgi:hypothetical protein
MKGNAMMCNVVVDLGNASVLTLGGGKTVYEMNARPMGRWSRSEVGQVTQIAELGSAAALTMGIGNLVYESNARPYGQIYK